MRSKAKYWLILARAAFAVLALALWLPSSAEAGFDSALQQMALPEIPSIMVLPTNEPGLGLTTGSIEHCRNKHSLFVDKDPTQPFVTLTESRSMDLPFIERLWVDVRASRPFLPEPSPRPPRRFV